MTKSRFYRVKNKKHFGQGVVEYSGALIMAGLIVALLATGAGEDQWMYNSYNNIINTATGYLMDEAMNIQ